MTSLPRRGSPTVRHAGAVGFTPCAAVARAAGCALVTLGAPTKTWSLAGLHASFVLIEDSPLRRRYLARAAAG